MFSFERLREVDFRNGYPLLTLPTGRGKTYSAIHLMKKRLDAGKNKFALMLVPTKTIKEQTLKDYEDVEPWTAFDFLPDAEGHTKIAIACFSAIAQYLADGNSIDAAPDFVCIDEIDQLARWSLCHPNNLLVWDWIVSNRSNMDFLGLTATPQLFDYVDMDFIDLFPDEDLRYKAKRIKVVEHSSLNAVLRTLRPSEEDKCLCYIRAAKDCIALSRRYENAGFIISEYNKTVDKDTGKTFGELMLEQQVSGSNESLRDYVLNKQELPQGCNILFINDAMAAGVNIRDDKVKTVIVDSCDLAIVEQVKGRLRQDVEELIVTYNFKERNTFFENLERARMFFDGPMIDLPTWNATEQHEIDKSIKENRSPKIDILTYRSGDEVRANPFAKAVYEYEFDIYRQLKDKARKRGYFRRLERHTDDGLTFVSGEEVQAMGRNKETVRDMDLRKLFGIPADKKSKVVSSKEITEIAKSHLRKSNGEPYGKTTLRTELEAAGIAQFTKQESRYYKGQKGTWYLLNVMQRPKTGG